MKTKKVRFCFILMSLLLVSITCSLQAMAPEVNALLGTLKGKLSVLQSQLGVLQRNLIELSKKINEPLVTTIPALKKEELEQKIPDLKTEALETKKAALKAYFENKSSEKDFNTVDNAVKLFAGLINYDNAFKDYLITEKLAVLDNNWSDCSPVEIVMLNLFGKSQPIEQKETIETPVDENSDTTKKSSGKAAKIDINYCFDLIVKLKKLFDGDNLNGDFKKHLLEHEVTLSKDLPTMSLIAVMLKTFIDNEDTSADEDIDLTVKLITLLDGDTSDGSFKRYLIETKISNGDDQNLSLMTQLLTKHYFAIHDKSLEEQVALIEKLVNQLDGTSGVSFKKYLMTEKIPLNDDNDSSGMTAISMLLIGLVGNEEISIDERLNLIERLIKAFDGANLNGDFKKYLMTEKISFDEDFLVSCATGIIMNIFVKDGVVNESIDLLARLIKLFDGDKADGAFKKYLMTEKISFDNDISEMPLAVLIPLKFINDDTISASDYVDLIERLIKLIDGQKTDGEFKKYLMTEKISLNKDAPLITLAVMLIVKIMSPDEGENLSEVSGEKDHESIETCVNLIEKLIKAFDGYKADGAFKKYLMTEKISQNQNSPEIRLISFVFMGFIAEKMISIENLYYLIELLISLFDGKNADGAFKKYLMTEKISSDEDGSEMTSVCLIIKHSIDQGKSDNVIQNLIKLLDRGQDDGAFKKYAIGNNGLIKVITEWKEQDVIDEETLEALKEQIAAVSSAGKLKNKLKK